MTSKLVTGNLVFGLHALEVIDKLLGAASGKASVGEFPLVGFRQQFRFRHTDTVSFRQCFYNILELFFVRCPKINGNAEPVYQ